MPNTYFESKLVFTAHAAQLFHEGKHVLYGFLRQASHAHEPSGSDFSQAGDGAVIDSVEVTHDWSLACPQSLLILANGDMIRTFIGAKSMTTPVSPSTRMTRPRPY